jgi:hypothetical protein
MTLFDLLLILLVLATIAGILIAAGCLLFRRRALAARLLLAILGAWILYLGAGTAVALETPPHIMRLGEDRCFDEMCFAVTGWNRVSSTNAGKSFYIVYVRISNRSRGRAQREIGRKGVLVDRPGRVYEVSSEGMRAVSPVNGAPYPGLDAEVGPGQTLETKLVFEVPESVDDPGFALGSSVAFNPARIVIGDEDHFLHWPTVVPLD